MQCLALLLLLPLPAALDVWIFTRTDCPVANRSAPAIAALRAAFAPRGVTFRLIYTEEGATTRTADAHRAAYGLLEIPAALDPTLTLARKAGARVTPEAAVFDADGALLYRGRIDDAQAKLGVARAPRKRDLEEAISQALAGRLRGLRTTRAIGCAIEGLRRP